MKVVLFILVASVALVAVVGAGFVTLTQNASAAPITGGSQSLLLEQTLPSDLTIALSERFLNQQVNRGLSTSADVRDVTIDLHSGNRADFSASLDVVLLTRITVRPRASVLLTLQNGRVALAVQQVDIAGIGIPSNLIESQISNLRTTGENLLNQQLALISANAGLTLRSVSTTETDLTLVFSQ